MKTLKNITLFIAMGIFLSCSSQPNTIEGYGPTLSSNYPIINGTPAGPEHGAVVGLHRLTKRRGGSVYVLPFCTGTLISPTVVLTAAHCLDKSEDLAGTTPLKANELAIYFGDSPGSLDENGNYDVLNGLQYVEEVLINPGYDKFTITNDVGLVRLRTAVTEAPLPALETAGFVVGETLTLVGFGEDENGNYGVKLTADVVLSSVLSSTQIEHSHLPEGICFGDSGGPALVSRNSVSHVGGVASYVTYPYCADTGAHTRVDAYSTWITDFLTPTTEPPTSCDLLSLGDLCTSDSQCCSGKCKGKTGGKTCK